MTAAVVGKVAKNAVASKAADSGGTVAKKAAPAKKATAAKKTTAAATTEPDKTSTTPAKSTPEKNTDSSGGTKLGGLTLPKTPAVPSAVSSGAGFILGLVFWSWVALPFLNQGGATGVKNMLRAKFFNKGPNGEWLP